MVGTGSLKWTIVTNGANANQEEHNLYSPSVGGGADWSSYDWVSFWMYVTSPTGGTKFGFNTQYMDDSAGWIQPLGGDGSPAVNSDTYPMDQWVRVRLSIHHIAALDRNLITESLWRSYENGDARYSVEDGHTFEIYIDDLRVELPDGWVTGHTDYGIELENIQIGTSPLGQCIVVPRSPSLDITGAFHASMWVLPYGNGEWWPVPGGQIQFLAGHDFGFSKGGSLDGGDGQNGYGMYVNRNAMVHGVISFQNGGIKDFWGLGTTVTDRLIADQWNYIAMDFDGVKTYRLWLNGSLRYQGVLSAPDTVKVSGNDLRIGDTQYSHQSTSFLYGVIDEFKITTMVPGAGGKIGGAITLQSFTGDKTLTPVRIEVLQGSTVIQSEDRTLEQSSAYTTGLLAPGTYDIAFSARGFLKEVVPGVLVESDETTPVSVTLLNGDVDGDNSVGTPDFSILSGNYGQ
ncbi:MAG: hypothetical protein A2147_04790 [Chloroflexi bacterium RBG_16_57_8]|nr:MAG: hypothetical protein A2147_04790 [Chloroflexi bacterium RBG_16_57_8]